MTPRIRPATLADLTILRLFWEALCREQGGPLTADDRQRWTTDTAMRLERQMGGDTSVYTTLAVDPAHDNPLGFLAGWIEERRIGAPHHYWMADHLYVVPEARGLGVGTALILAGMTHARQVGCTVLECIAVAGDTQWARRGWTPTLTRYQTEIPSMETFYTKAEPLNQPVNDTPIHEEA